MTPLCKIELTLPCPAVVQMSAAQPPSRPPSEYQASCVDDPVEARAIWYVAPRSGAVMGPAYVARPYDRWP